MDSAKVLSIFKEITKVPRESGHEEKIIAFLQDFARTHSLECHTDEIGNVLIIKEAAEGFENVPTIVLQSHSDMVCEKNAGVEHDFTKDPIKYVIEDGWMIAKDTTLGADDGIGCASELALLESDLPTGRLECLFTVSEETGLDGAFALKPDFISGKHLINLDSEDEGELFVGCAGGLDTTAVFNYWTEDIAENDKLVTLKVFGGQGGHSGDDIDKGRSNAVQIISRFLYTQLDRNFRIIELEGGNKRNAIAREAHCILAVADAAGMEADFKAFAEEVKAEYATVEPALGFSFALEAAITKQDVGKTVSLDDTQRIVRAMAAAPHGVLAMSPDIKGLVETSTNLASIKMPEAGKFRVGTSQRSSIASACRMAGDKVEACFLLAGAEVTHESEYPGWKPNLNSRILDASVASYKKLFGVEPVVRAIHAGLECGLFLDKYPDLDMISFGPTLRGVHAPGERLDLASLDKFVALLVDVVVNFR